MEQKHCMFKPRLRHPLLAAARRLYRYISGRGPSIHDRFEIGRGSYGEPHVPHWGEQEVLKIGAFCSIADGVTIFLGGNHPTNWVTTFPFPILFKAVGDVPWQPRSNGDVVIGNDVWIGANATILSGVTIGNGAVIGAHALVSRNVPAYAVVGGNPARLIKMRFSEEHINRLQKIEWWNWEDLKIQEAMPLLLSADIDKFLIYAERRN